MALWTEIDGSPAWDESSGNRARYVRRFQADVDNGKTQAAAEGYAKGDTITVNSTVLKLSDISVRNRRGFDEVTIIYTTPGGYVNPRRAAPNSDYNDEKIREAKDEEWWIEVDTDEIPAKNAFDFEGNAWSGTWNVQREDPVIQPNALLCWRKWLDKNNNPATQAPKTLPTTKKECLDALKTYLPNQKGGYEPNPPKLMFRLGPNGIEANLLCISIDLEEDGALVARTAKYKYSGEAWNNQIFG